MSRAAMAKEFPTKPEQAIPEMFEKPKGVPLKDLPESVQELYVSTIQKDINKGYKPSM